MELALVSRLRLNTKIIYCLQVVFIEIRCIFLKGDIINNLNVFNLELSGWTV